MYEATRVAVNTALGGCGGGLGCLSIHMVVYRNHVIVPALNGVLGGLVSITAAGPYIEPYAAIITGLIGGMIVFFGSWLLKVNCPPSPLSPP